MLQSISETIFGNTGKEKNVNMTPRAGKRAKKAGEGSSDEHIIESLRNDIKIKDAAIAALSAKIDRLEDESRLNQLEAMVKRRHRPVATVSHVIDDNGRQKSKMGTRGSLVTQNILEAMNEPKRSTHQQLAEKFLQVFKDPVQYIPYLQSEQFARELIQMCQAVRSSFEEQPRCIFLQSPVYVFGDIHGNLEDLHFFSDNLWRLGMDLAAGQFLFLGDYVDRGMSCLEVVAYLFGLRLLFPHKITMLRGNHETRDVSS